MYLISSILTIIVLAIFVRKYIGPRARKYSLLIFLLVNSLIQFLLFGIQIEYTSIGVLLNFCADLIQRDWDWGSLFNSLLLSVSSWGFSWVSLFEFDILIKFFKLVFSFLIDHHHQDKLLVGGALETYTYTYPANNSNFLTELYSDNPTKDVTSSNTGSSSSNPVSGDKSPTREVPTITVGASGDPMEIDSPSQENNSPSQENKEDENIGGYLFKGIQKKIEDSKRRGREKVAKGEWKRNKMSREYFEERRSRSRGKELDKKRDNLKKNLMETPKFKKDAMDMSGPFQDSFKEVEAAQKASEAAAAAKQNNDEI